MPEAPADFTARVLARVARESARSSWTGWGKAAAAVFGVVVILSCVLARDAVKREEVPVSLRAYFFDLAGEGE